MSATLGVSATLGMQDVTQRSLVVFRHASPTGFFEVTRRLVQAAAHARRNPAFVGSLSACQPNRVFRSHPAFGTSSGLRAIGPREGLDATWQEVAAKAAVQGLDTLVLHHSVLLQQPPCSTCVAMFFASTCCGVCIAAKSWTCSPGTRCCRMEVHQQAPCQDGVRTACPGYAHCPANTPIAANLSCTSWPFSGHPQGTWCKSVARSGTRPATYSVRQLFLQQAQKPTAC